MGINWDSQEIFEKVIISSEKFGYRNPQQANQLFFTLSKCNQQAVLEALFRIFYSEAYYFTAQELAGRLLLDIKPKGLVSLKEILYPCLETYNLSVEELPYYIVDVYGYEEFETVLKNLESTKLSERQIRSINTMLWWANGYIASKN